jgi:superoxide dismutase, Cu-Zn family
MLSKAAVLPLACSLLLGACATTGEGAKPQTLALATLEDGTGKAIGTARVEQTGTAIVLVAEARGISPGDHGIHLHAAGKCEAPGFTSAGGHLNPASHQHGSMNPAGPHLGDLPNLPVGADGSGSVRAPLTGPAASLLADLFDADGTAVVVHAGPDDYKTDPSGNSGGRIACGVLSRAG